MVGEAGMAARCRRLREVATGGGRVGWAGRDNAGGRAGGGIRLGGGRGHPVGVASSW